MDNMLHSNGVTKEMDNQFFTYYIARNLIGSFNSISQTSTSYQILF